MVTKTNSEQSLLTANSAGQTIGQTGGALEDQISSLLAQNRSPTGLTGLNALSLAAPAAVTALAGGPAVSDNTVDYFQRLTENAQGFTPAAAFAGELAGTRDKQNALASTTQQVSDAFRLAGQNRQQQEQQQFERLQTQQDFNLRLAQHNDTVSQRNIENERAASTMDFEITRFNTDTGFRNLDAARSDRGIGLQERGLDIDVTNSDRAASLAERQFRAGRGDAKFNQLVQNADLGIRGRQLANQETDAEFNRGLAASGDARAETALKVQQQQNKFQNDLAMEQFKNQKKVEFKGHMVDLMKVGHQQQQLALQVKAQNQATKQYNGESRLREQEYAKVDAQLATAQAQRKKTEQEIELIEVQQGVAAADVARQEALAAEKVRGDTTLQFYMTNVQKDSEAGYVDSTGQFIQGKSLPYNELIKMTVARYGQPLLALSPQTHNNLMGLHEGIVSQENETKRADAAVTKSQKTASSGDLLSRIAALQDGAEE